MGKFIKAPDVSILLACAFLPLCFFTAAAASRCIAAFAAAAAFCFATRLAV
jgi:hypothetical protein